MRKKEIKQAALKLFASNGFEGTSLADIAGVVGLKKQSIYSHFKDKDDLFLSIMKDAKSTEIDYYRAHLQDSDLSRPDLVLASLLFGVKNLYDTDAGFQFWLRYGFYPPKHLYDIVQAEISDNVSQMEQDFTVLFSNWIAQKLIPEQDVETMKEAYMGILDAVIVEIVYVNEPQRSERKITALWQIFWRGITLKA
ncbi:efflux pump transcriptional regulator FepR [Listeria ivanovii]|uniref:Putative transcription regulators n=1 Tax=Listeria ivanovii (strain ATCC BAA-678 / PAM 55) TaxID=881621 RepID=G2ZDI6_LISIP|nr:efflux pump transcriptional regulator FepR [Listeria ivanovii]AHI56602.1 TetR family transcriptional regulator [Listeria ivanovii WSLC3009]AIS66020.1 TetR family transcriptional regulator [Listeria ivanovii subsp. ivanovii]MBC1758939.1 TetR/AcrR family transcriptional regulator [Listeria ivanovii]MBK3913962.1 TetR/AcrR family transcriptional regulator [Listeria ivanovii subsp. ivanovii]MBK3921200.1 TetR/AcrR family transcriptional regulator [Listeria ivanovii subsp. ivanovii]